MPEDAGWLLGTDLAYLRELVAYWADEFDWAAQEAGLARFPHVRVRLGGLGHFVHIRGRPGRARSAADPQPRLAGLVLALREGDPTPTDPGAHGADAADAFDVVVPDMPGCWATRGSARRAGDIDSHVSRYLALDYPELVVAVHRTDAGVPVFTGDRAGLAPEERAWLEGAAAWERVRISPRSVSD
jgi:Epoxide hydrolase N terminus